jgi:hypothetical protein
MPGLTPLTQIIDLLIDLLTVLLNDPLIDLLIDPLTALLINLPDVNPFPSRLGDYPDLSL